MADEIRNNNENENNGTKKTFVFHNDQHAACCETDGYIDMVKEDLPKDETLFELADFFKNFGDSTRMKLISVLLRGEMCVGTITDIVGMSQSSVSHQLKVLRQARLVKTRREGKYLYYCLNDEHVKMIYQLGLEHVNE